MAYDEMLAIRIRAVFSEDAAVSEKRMFGGLAFLYKGHMFVGVSGSELMARVGKQNYQTSLDQKHVRKMDFTGKPMQGYVYIEPPGLMTDRQLSFWLERCKDFVCSLPEKKATK